MNELEGRRPGVLRHFDRNDAAGEIEETATLTGAGDAGTTTEASKGESRRAAGVRGRSRATIAAEAGTRRATGTTSAAGGLVAREYNAGRNGERRRLGPFATPPPMPELASPPDPPGPPPRPSPPPPPAVPPSPLPPPPASPLPPTPPVPPAPPVARLAVKVTVLPLSVVVPR